MLTSLTNLTSSNHSLARTTSSFGDSYAVAESSSSSLDQNAFYKLLAAQLQNQDPLAGSDNTQMVLQMTQMATIEQLTNLNNSFTSFMENQMVMGGANFVGQHVVMGTTDGGTISGVVEEVGFSSSGTLLKVNGEYHSIWRIISVGTESNNSVNNGASTGSVESTNNNTSSIGSVESTDMPDWMDPNALG